MPVLFSGRDKLVIALNGWKARGVMPVFVLQTKKRKTVANNIREKIIFDGKFAW